MEERPDYKHLISEIIQKQSLILGPEMAIMRACRVPGLVITAAGDVADISGDAKEVLQELVDQYAALSGQVVRTALHTVFQKYSVASKVNDV
jgi:hypothetical protein